MEESEGTMGKIVLAVRSFVGRGDAGVQAGRGARYRRIATSSIVAAAQRALESTCRVLASVSMQPRPSAAVSSTTVVIDLAALRRHKAKRELPLTLAQWRTAVRLLPRRATPAAIDGLERVFAVARPNSDEL
jgi:hypothetical protein